MAVGKARKPHPLRRAPVVHPQPVLRKPSRHVRRWVLLAAILIAGLPLLPGLRPTDWLARSWRARWALVPTATAVRRIPHLPRMGTDGWELLVDALADTRLPVVRAAAQQLELEYEAWSEQPSAEIVRHAACVLNRLNLRAPHLAPESLAAVERVARGLIVRQVDPRMVDELQWIANCEALLLLVQQQKQAALLARSGPRSSDTEKVVAEEPGDEPPEPPLAAGLLSDGPPLLAERVLSQPARADLVAPNTSSDTLEVPRAVASGTTELALPTIDIQEQSETELLDMLAHADAEVVLRAAAELERRGYSPEAVTMAEHLLDPAADTRLAMAQQLPALPIEQLRPWLLRLSRDEDLRVRRVAVSHLAASADPQLRRRLREIEATEMDPVILRRIEQANRQ